MVRSANLRKFKSPLITDYFLYISVQKITHFLSFPSKSWCKFFPAPALLKPTPHKDFRRFFLLITQCKNKHLPTFRWSVSIPPTPPNAPPARPKSRSPGNRLPRRHRASVAARPPCPAGIRFWLPARRCVAR